MESMPEDNPQVGVNQDVSVASPAPESQAATVEQPPAESTTAQPKHEQFVPYSRFKEVNDRAKSHEDRAKSHEAKIAELEKQLASRNAVTSDVPYQERKIDMSKYAKLLTDKGLDEKAAATLSEVMQDIAKEEAASHYTAESEKAVKSQKEAQERLVKARQEVESWETEFKKTHEDYAELEPVMRKKWEGLDENARMALVTSPKSLELLYEVAKSTKIVEEREKGVEEGRSQAYQTKSLKSAVSSTPGTTASPSKKFTAEDVPGMSKDFYEANKPQILRDLGIVK